MALLWETGAVLAAGEAMMPVFSKAPVAYGWSIYQPLAASQAIVRQSM